MYMYDSTSAGRTDLYHVIFVNTCIRNCNHNRYSKDDVYLRRSCGLSYKLSLHHLDKSDSMYHTHYRDDVPGCALMGLSIREKVPQSFEQDFWSVAAEVCPRYGFVVMNIGVKYL